MTAFDPKRTVGTESILKRISAYWFVATRMVLYFLQTLGRESFWDWTWKRVHDPRSVDHENVALVWTLLKQAWQRREHIRVLATYRDFEVIFNRSWHGRWRERVIATVHEAEASTYGKDLPPSEQDYVIHADYRPPRNDR